MSQLLLRRSLLERDHRLFIVGWGSSLTASIVKVVDDIYPVVPHSCVLSWRHHPVAYLPVSSGFVNERTWAASGSMSGAFMGFFEADSRAVTERARDRRRFSIEETALL